MSNTKHALVVPLYGELQAECLDRLKSWVERGFWVVVVNNNPTDTSLEGVEASAVVQNHNHQGLAGGLNAGIDVAIADGADCITLLDQDSLISCDSLGCLAKACSTELIVGPRIFDKVRRTEHSPARYGVRMLISSGTTFIPNIWKITGPFHGWMEIDYIDHEWCSRARKKGFSLSVIDQATLFQTFGVRHPNRIAHYLGLQLYSPYRRAIAIRNLRWLLRQNQMPLDIRLKELVKMLLKPWIWLIFESDRRHCLAVIWIGLTAPHGKAFPRAELEAFR